MRGVESTRQIGNVARLHWPEVDGLRAIAVIPVMIFHLDRSAMSGGFVGVDIFFVISGFLITALLTRDIDHDRFSIAAFYQRRIARIAPAFFLVLAFTLAASAFVYARQDIASAGATAAFAAMSLANIKFMLQGNYFDVSPDAQPSLHYWSLSVEEQFYLVFPVLLFLLLRHNRRPIAIALSFAAMSYAACIILTEINAVWAFYLLPTRAFELLGGAALALLMRKNGFMPLRQTWWMPATGLILIVASLALIEEQSSFPGAVVIAPVLGTVLVLTSAGGDGVVGRVLSHPLPVFVGLRSYSLYLWHWPIYSFIDYRLFELDPLVAGAAKVSLTIALALITYQLVERPARHFLNQARFRWFTFTVFLIASAALAGVGYGLRTANYFDATPQSIASGGVTIDAGQRARIALIGDSEGAMYGAELAAIARANGYTANLLAMPGETVLPDRSGSYWPEIRRYLSRSPPDVIILVEAWSARLEADDASLATALRHLRPLAPVVLVTQPPLLPTEASREGVRNGARPPFFEPSEARLRRTHANSLVQGFEGYGVSVIDVAPLFLDARGAIEVFDSADRMNFHDARHLSSFGTARVRPLLERQIAMAIEAGREEAP